MQGLIFDIQDQFHGINPSKEEGEILNLLSEIEFLKPVKNRKSVESLVKEAKELTNLNASRILKKLL